MSTTLDETKPGTIKRDRYGRYLIPDPETGKEKAWTRVTTFAEAIEDRYNIELWKMRTVAVGLAKRKDLLALVSSNHDDKQALNKTVGDALKAGGSEVSANLGTALHGFTERHDRGETGFPVPEDLQGDLDVYIATMSASGLYVPTLPDGRKAIECIVIVPSLGVAGTFDRAWTHPNADVWSIGDLKTGASAIEWAMGGISIQLATYAHGSHFFDPSTGELTEIAPGTFDQVGAIVAHLPVGKNECKLYEVDIEAGWEAAQLCLGVRKWRNRKNLSKEITNSSSPVVGAAGSEDDASVAAAPTVTEAPLATVTHINRRAWLVERCRSARDQGKVKALQEAWPEGVPLPSKAAEWTVEHMDTIEGTLNVVEAFHELPFIPEPVPAPAPDDGPPYGPVWKVAPVDEGQPVSAGCVEEVEQGLAGLEGEASTWARSMAKAMADVGRPLKFKENPTSRRYYLALAVIAWAQFHDDDMLRAALKLGRGGALGPALAWLDETEAHVLIVLADDLANGRLHFTYTANGDPVLTDPPKPKRTRKAK